MATTNYVNNSRRRTKKKSKRLPVTVTLIFIIAFLFIFSVVGNMNSYGDAETEYIEVLIESGSSIWSIAKEYTPNGHDVRTTVKLIVNANNLESSIIYPGNFLKVPKIY